MAPRGHTLPAATTESALEARKSFYCDICTKGYARANDYDAHISSYEHTHRRRLTEMKQMTRDPNASSRAREADARDADLRAIAMPLPTANQTGPKKKPVFKSTLQPQNANAILSKPKDVAMGDSGKAVEYDANGAIANGWAHDQYDPARPTQYKENFDITQIMTAEERRRYAAEQGRGRR